MLWIHCTQTIEAFEATVGKSLPTAERHKIYARCGNSVADTWQPLSGNKPESLTFRDPGLFLEKAVWQRQFRMAYGDQFAVGRVNRLQHPRDNLPMGQPPVAPSGWLIPQLDTLITAGGRQHAPRRNTGDSDAPEIEQTPLVMPVAHHFLPNGPEHRVPGLMEPCHNQIKRPLHKLNVLDPLMHLPVIMVIESQGSHVMGSGIQSVP